MLAEKSKTWQEFLILEDGYQAIAVDKIHTLFEDWKIKTRLNEAPLLEEHKITNASGDYVYPPSPKLKLSSF